MICHEDDAVQTLFVCEGERDYTRRHTHARIRTPTHTLIHPCAGCQCLSHKDCTARYNGQGALGEDEDFFCDDCHNKVPLGFKVFRYYFRPTKKQKR